MVEKNLHGMEEAGIIYNVTTKVDANIAGEWLRWMQEQHIPGILQTGCFISNKIVRLLELDDSEGPTYAIQYGALDLVEYTRYLTEHAAYFRQELINKWGDQCISFRSLMEVIG